LPSDVGDQQRQLSRGRATADEVVRERTPGKQRIAHVSQDRVVDDVRLERHDRCARTDHQERERRLSCVGADVEQNGRTVREPSKEEEVLFVRHATAPESRDVADGPGHVDPHGRQLARFAGD
jgi:hypothetical protein